MTFTQVRSVTIKIQDTDLKHPAALLHYFKTPPLYYKCPSLHFFSITCHVSYSDNFVFGPVRSPQSGPPSAATTSVVTPRSHQKGLEDCRLTKERNLIRKIPQQILLLCTMFWVLKLRPCSDGKIMLFFNVSIPHGTVVLAYSSSLCVFASLYTSLLCQQCRRLHACEVTHHISYYKGKICHL